MANVPASAHTNTALQKTSRRSALTFTPTSPARTASTTGDSAAVIHPISRLHDQITRLDAAMVVCRAIPKKEPVHSLRKATRYVEAQLALLELIPNLPEHTAEVDRVRKRLKAVRRAAGSVRDFDVQRGLVRDLVNDDESAKNPKAKNETSSASDEPARASASGKNKKKGKKSSSEAELRSEAQALAKYLKRQREQDADKLTDVLNTEEQRLAKALRKLETALKPAEQRTIPADRLASEIQRWFQEHTPHLAGSNDGSDPLESLDENALHSLRKTSKICRYMAEGLPDDFATAQQLASRYEEIQESGGQWHDWLLLRDLAAHRQGKRAALPQHYAEQRDQALARYRSRLADLLPANGVEAAESSSEQPRATRRRASEKDPAPQVSQPLEAPSSARQ